jgi:hypothetical protein
MTKAKMSAGALAGGNVDVGHGHGCERGESGRVREGRGQAGVTLSGNANATASESEMAGAS